jgi:preprotein translocase subunit SecG
MLHTFLMIIHFFCAAGIVALVLLQRGKGAEAGAGFGAGASGTVFGARGATTALSRATAILAAIFMVTSLSLAYVGTRKSAAPSGVLDQFATPAAPAGEPQGGAAAPPAAQPPGSTGTPATPTGSTGAQGGGMPAATPQPAPASPSAPSTPASVAPAASGSPAPAPK